MYTSGEDLLSDAFAARTGRIVCVNVMVMVAGGEAFTIGVVNLLSDEEHIVAL